jgi:hypothetical protein
VVRLASAHSAATTTNRTKTTVRQHGHFIFVCFFYSSSAPVRRVNLISKFYFILHAWTPPPLLLLLRLLYRAPARMVVCESERVGGDARTACMWITYASTAWMRVWSELPISTNNPAPHSRPPPPLMLRSNRRCLFACGRRVDQKRSKKLKNKKKLL